MKLSLIVPEICSFILDTYDSLMDTLNLNVFVVFTDMLRVSRTVFRAAASITRAVGRGLNKHECMSNIQTYGFVVIYYLLSK